MSKNWRYKVVKVGTKASPMYVIGFKHIIEGGEEYEWIGSFSKNDLISLIADVSNTICRDHRVTPVAEEAGKEGLQDGRDSIPDDAVYGDTDSMLKLFCNECNKIVGNPIWDDQTHGPYCPDCKTTLIEKSPD